MKGNGVNRRPLHKGNLTLTRTGFSEMSEEQLSLTHPLNLLLQIHLEGRNNRTGLRLTSANMNAETDSSAVIKQHQGTLQ